MKKNPKLDYRRKSGLFFNIGLVVSLLMAITAFEWKFPDNVTKVDVLEDDYVDETILVPITSHVTPPPPKVVPVDFVEVPDIVEIVQENPDYTLDSDESAALPPVVYEMAEPAAESVEIIHVIVESMPEFDGGISAFYKFVGENLKYPAQARRLGIEGKVYVNFVVDRDGSLSQLVIARGIGAGCDEEVLRILEMSPKWIPGKQRGNPVNVRMMLPITFKLQ